MRGSSNLKVEFKQVSFEYRSSLMPVHRALERVSFKIGAGEIVAIVGPSGSGKTTLLQHLNGLLRPTSGRIFIDDQDLHSSAGLLQQIRRRIGVVFQFPEIQLFEERVAQDVAFGPKNIGMTGAELDQHVQSALQMVGLDLNKYKDRSPFHLSGGEKRRVAIAGILAMNPEILVLDEPTVGLDQSSTDCIVRVIRTYQSSGKTVIFVSHNIDLVAELSDRILVLEEGRVTFDGSCPDLFSNDAVLERAALRLPQIVAWMRSLVRRGLAVRTDVYSIQEAKAEMRRVMRFT